MGFILPKSKGFWPWNFFCRKSSSSNPTLNLVSCLLSYKRCLLLCPIKNNVAIDRSLTAENQGQDDELPTRPTVPSRRGRLILITVFKGKRAAGFFTNFLAGLFPEGSFRGAASVNHKKVKKPPPPPPSGARAGAGHLQGVLCIIIIYWKTVLGNARLKNEPTFHYGSSTVEESTGPPICNKWAPFQNNNENIGLLCCILEPSSSWRLRDWPQFINPLK